jgi:hypothetical protein
MFRPLLRFRVSLLDQFNIPPCRCNAFLRFLLKGMQHIHPLAELDGYHGSISVAGLQILHVPPRLSRFEQFPNQYHAANQLAQRPLLLAVDNAGVPRVGRIQSQKICIVRQDHSSLGGRVA